MVPHLAPATTQLSPAFTMAADAECMIREQIVESVKIFPQECLPQRLNDQIVDIPVPSIAEVPGVPCATPVGPQIGDFWFRQGWATVRNHLDRCEIVAYPWPGQGLQPLEKNADDTSRASGYQSATSLKSTMPSARSFDCGRCTSWLPPALGREVRGTRLKSYGLAEIESILENFEFALKGIVLAEYVIHVCTKPVSCCRLASSTMRSRWLLRFGLDLRIYLFHELPDRNIITSALMFPLR